MNDLTLLRLLFLGGCWLPFYIFIFLLWGRVFYLFFIAGPDHPYWESMRQLMKDIRLDRSRVDELIAQCLSNEEIARQSGWHVEAVRRYVRYLNTQAEKEAKAVR